MGNKQGKDKIEWTDETLNPVVGCTHNCHYCYARAQAKRRKKKCNLCYEFTPHAHLERLNTLNPKQKPKKIFIDSMWDWNCVSNDQNWLTTIIKKMAECKQHTFQILSKRPEGYQRFKFPNNCWIGTSIDTNKTALERYNALIGSNKNNLKYISFEPLLEDVNINLEGIGWIIIGADSRRRAKKPLQEWANKLIAQARELNTPVFVKDNYGYPERINEFPLNGKESEIMEIVKGTIRDNGGKFTSENIKNAKLWAYKIAMRSNSIEDQEYWLQRVFHSSRVARQYVNHIFSKERKHFKRSSSINEEYREDCIPQIPVHDIRSEISRTESYVCMKITLSELLDEIKEHHQGVIFTWILEKNDLERFLSNDFDKYLITLRNLEYFAKMDGTSIYANRSEFVKYSGYSTQNVRTLEKNLQKIYKRFYM